jgi:hypothetical protein
MSFVFMSVRSFWRKPTDGTTWPSDQAFALAVVAPVASAFATGVVLPAVGAYTTVDAGLALNIKVNGQSVAATVGTLVAGSDSIVRMRLREVVGYQAGRGSCGRLSGGRDVAGSPG